MTFILTLLNFDYKNICLEYCAIMNFDFHFHNATAYTKMHVNNYKRMGYFDESDECEGCRCTFGRVRSSGMQL